MNTNSRRNYQQDFQPTQSSPGPLRAADETEELEPAISIFVIEKPVAPPTRLRGRLDAFPAARIIGESADASDAVAMLQCLSAQLVVINSEEQSIEGLDSIRRIEHELPGLPILVLSSSKSSHHAQACLRAGATGYCLSDAPLSRLALAIGSVSDGAAWIDPELSAPVLRPVPFRLQSSGNVARELPLTERELQVLRLIAEGMSNLEIAAELVLSPETIKTHIKHIMEKLAVNDRTLAAVHALRLGLVS